MIAEPMEINRLRAELARVKMERDILVIAMAHTVQKGRFEARLHAAAEPPPGAGFGAMQGASGKHGWLPRPPGTQPHHLGNEALLVHIKALYCETRSVYG